jgi:hypothetical protein
MILILIPLMKLVNTWSSLNWNWPSTTNKRR